MASSGGKEGCGRCGFSTVVDVVEGANDGAGSTEAEAEPDRETGGADVGRRSGEASAAGDEAPDSGAAEASSADAPSGPIDEDAGRYDPFEGRYIEVDERDLKLVSAPAVAAGRAKRWLDRTAHRLIWGG